MIFIFLLLIYFATVFRSIYISTNDPVLSRFTAEEYLIAFTYHIFIHSPVNGHFILNVMRSWCEAVAWSDVQF